MKLKSAYESLALLILIIVFIVAIPNAEFQTWYGTNRAQISTSAEDTTFFNDDIIGNLFNWVSDAIFVPIWNTVFASDLIRNIVAPALFIAIIGGLGYDVFKSFFALDR